MILSFRLHKEKNCRCKNFASKKKRHGEENAVNTNTKAPSKKEKRSKTRKFWPGNGGLKKCKTEGEETHKCCKYQRICLHNLQDKKIMSRKTSRQLCKMCLLVVVVVVVVAIVVVEAIVVVIIIVVVVLVLIVVVVVVVVVVVAVVVAAMLDALRWLTRQH